MSSVGDPRAVLDALLESDSEEGVVRALTQAGLWDEPSAWRYYGDTPGNYGNAGNQQSNPEAALVEKLTNAIDASLMLHCQLRGVDPRSEQAPHSIREAVALFYDNAQPGQVRDFHGLIAEWDGRRMLEVARTITLASSGPTASGGRMSLWVADAGEGQSPEDLPNTILSIDRQLKQRIPFVQGKWNMGGTGALRFAGALGLQLVVSKRHPELASREGKSSDWGFTIVRREDPNPERRVSALRYLAPVGANRNPNQGSVLSVSAATLPLFPQGRSASGRAAEWGTLIKLYEYATNHQSHLLRRDGLLRRLDLLLPEPALPIRLYECRDYRGAPGSFENTLTGVRTRLKDSDNIEPGFPDSGQISIGGETIPFTVYAFKSSAEDTYRKSEGVLFVVNGQTHAAISDRFFRRRDVAMGNLQKSLLVVLDCSLLRDRSHEMLFMNSRDRLSDAPLAHAIQKELADVLHEHEGLRALRERRRREEAERTLEQARPVEEVLQNLIRKQPSLSALFLWGEHASNPFSLVDKPTKEYVGHLHPTEFRFKGRPYGEVLIRDSHLGEKSRITFETDVVNDYFTRTANRGIASVTCGHNGSPAAFDMNLNLRDGFAHLNITLPPEAKPGDSLELAISVTDPTLVEPFVNRAVLRVRPAHHHPPGPPRPPRRRPEEQGNGRTEKRPGGIALPEIEDVYKESWESRGMTEDSGARAVQVDETAAGQPVYKFYVNQDNRFLLAEIKGSRDVPEVLRARYRFALVLAGLGALRAVDASEDKERSDSEESPRLDAEDAVRIVTDALAPVILPLIASLGALTPHDLDEEAAGTAIVE